MKRGPRLGAAFLVVILALSGAACSESGDDSSVEISAKGGEYKLGDVTVKVSEGTVSQETELLLTKAETITPQQGWHAGSRQPGVRFDLSLANGQQPKKPVEVAIPLKGSFLPSGAKPEHAFLFTRTANGKHNIIVPAEVDSAGVLHAKLTHFSEKNVLYFTPDDMAKMVESGALQVMPQIGCTTWLEAPGRFKVASSSAPDRIEGCLEVVGKTATMTASNKTSYMWSVSASQSGTTIVDTVDSIEQQGIEAIAKIFPQNWGKSFMAPGGFVRGNLESAKMPNTFTFKAEPVNFYAEIIWMALTFAIEMSTGNKPNEALDMVKAFVAASELQTCLTDMFKGENSIKSSAFYNIFTKCGELIFAAIVKLVGEEAAQGIDGFFKKRIFAIGGLFRNGFTSILTGIEGLKQTVAGGEATVGVSSGDCLTQSEFNARAARMLKEAGHRGTYYKVAASDNRWEPFQVLCQDGWAATRVKAYGSAEDVVNDFSYNFGPLLIKWSAGEWKGVSFTPLPFDCGEDGCPPPNPTNRQECQKAPQRLRSLMQC